MRQLWKRAAAFFVSAVLLLTTAPFVYANAETDPVGSDKAQEQIQEDAAYAKYDAATNTLTFFRDTEKHVEGETDGTIRYFPHIEDVHYNSYDEVPWGLFKGCNISKVVFEDPIHPVSTSFWFYYLSQMTEIEGLDKLDTSGVTDMQDMFGECRSLESIDLSSFDTSGVTNMKEMFYRCEAVTSLDVSAFDTSNVQDMSSMFSGCVSLEELDLSDFSTASLQNINSMFARDSALSRLDLRNFDININTNTSMFAECKSLRYIALGTGRYPSAAMPFENWGLQESFAGGEPGDVHFANNLSAYNEFGGQHPGWYEKIPAIVFQKEQDGITYTLDEDGTLKVTGEGAIPDRLDVYRTERDSIKAIEIGEGITSIGAYDFSDHQALTRVSLPSTLIAVGERALLENAMLTDISFPQGSDTYQVADGMLLTKDGKALLRCTTGAGETVNVPDGVETIAPYAFDATLYAAKNPFTEIVLPKSVRTLEDYAFYGCQNLVSVNLGGISEMGKYAFNTCVHLKEADISGLTAVPAYAFDGCRSLEKIVFPEDLEEIGKYAFFGCRGLKELHLPDTLRYIRESAIGNTGLESLVIPPSVELIEKNALDRNYQLAEITILNPDLVFREADKYVNGDLNRDFHGYEGGDEDIGPWVDLVCVLRGYDGSTTQTYAKAVYPQRTFGSLNIGSMGISIEPQIYTGKALTPDPVVMSGNTRLEAGRDYTVSYKNNKTLGTATATITAVPGSIYKGSAETTFRICKPFDKSHVTVSEITDKTYNGTPRTHTITIKYDGKVLTKKGNYTVKYENNTSAGKATVTISGTGLYHGTITKTFTIKKLDIAKCTFPVFNSKTWTGDAKTPSFKVCSGSVKLVKDRDYTVSYQKNKNIGTADIVVYGKTPNCTGSTVLHFKIVPMKTTLQKVSPLSKAFKVYWDKQTAGMPDEKVDGYQIQWSTSSSFAKNNHTKKVAGASSSSKTINSKIWSGIKGGQTYYVRIRTYKVVDGKTYYSYWSDKTKVKTKR